MDVQKWKSTICRKIYSIIKRQLFSMFSFSGNNGGGVVAMLVGADGRSRSDIITLLEVLPRYPASGQVVSRGTLDLGLPD
jgi:hypothetical protein